MKIVMMSILFASLGIGSAAMADEHGHDADRPNASQQDRHDDHGDDHRDSRDNHSNDRGNQHDEHRDEHSDRDKNHGHYGVYNRPKGYQDHRWARGERLPKAYYSRSYVVVNYQARGWRQPPRGYHWVRVNDDVVLAAIATGVVLDVLFNQF
jgi:Ni/Co efflux regulator RcnB